MSLRILLSSSVTLLDITHLTGIILLCVLQSVHASWWYLGIASSYQSTLGDLDHIPGQTKCSLPYLEPRQRELCKIDDKLLEVITEGASLGINECQFQFQNRRWNCSTFNTTNVFGKVLNIKSRETAYIYAIFSAGVMHTVTRACAKGELSQCGCDVKVRHTNTKGEYEWGGCSDNVQYGARFSKEFVDVENMKFSDDGLMNLWNNEAGRRAVKNDLELMCKCHGISGSCSVKICWRKMKDFRMTGTHLKEKFDRASRVQLNKRRNKLRPVNRRLMKPTKKDLVYLHESPDFCEQNSKYGSLGTHGRQCKRNSYGLDGCTLMCCGRGYYTIIKEIKQDCDCKFFWCCRVECKKCTHTVEMNYCN